MERYKRKYQENSNVRIFKLQETLKKLKEENLALDTQNIIDALNILISNFSNNLNTEPIYTNKTNAILDQIENLVNAVHSLINVISFEAQIQAEDSNRQETV